ncbi:hypothetical protein DDE18_15620 [Nocardioides gansuensis]|uniref:Protein NO VEIN C-terminal domain-containing protein n=1 Tax=Nocardioides gansuensis TaxID=2138300 RepID=A0A2T8F8Q9_9ACTN|nr:DUF3883 domain-containing protein [Nocardioides gansuensis]PVG82106.1 hypothetical protein DDE18_15620 [Nocardioides gansuensis]
MPVVLVEVGGVARSGHLYGDRTGIEYEYPDGRYEAWIQPGERFVYQTPRIGYIGYGIVGDVRPSPAAGRRICRVDDVRYFEKPVPLKNPAGSYYEADTTYWRDKVYWGQGVRPLSDERFDQILSVGSVPANLTSNQAEQVSPVYTDAETSRRVERISVNAAIAAMCERFKVHVKEMPRNNPGFDLLVGQAKSPLRYVEVKGTQSAAPVFFMSDGEREFSRRYQDRYTLVVVSGIDVTAGSHTTLTVRDGALDGDDVEMKVSQWRGRVV